MLGVYFSGTGNTKYVLNLFLKNLGQTYSISSIEDKDTLEKIKENKDIVIAHSIHYSCIPKIFRDFLDNNIELFRDKNIFIITTMGLFSGDGCGLSERKLRKVGANVTGGLQVKMPNSVCDVKALKRSREENKDIVNDAEKKIKEATDKIKKQIKVKEGIGFLPHIAGLFGQRLYFKHKVENYSNNLKFDKEKCTKCGKCTKACPMNNLKIEESIKRLGKCTMC